MERERPDRAPWESSTSGHTSASASRVHLEVRRRIWPRTLKSVAVSLLCALIQMQSSATSASIGRQADVRGRSPRRGQRTTDRVRDTRLVPATPQLVPCWLPPGAPALTSPACHEAPARCRCLLNSSQTDRDRAPGPNDDTTLFATITQADPVAPRRWVEPALIITFWTVMAVLTAASQVLDPRPRRCLTPVFPAAGNQPRVHRFVSVGRAHPVHLPAVPGAFPSSTRGLARPHAGAAGRRTGVSMPALVDMTIAYLRFRGLLHGAVVDAAVRPDVRVPSAVLAGRPGRLPRRARRRLRARLLPATTSLGTTRQCCSSGGVAAAGRGRAAPAQLAERGSTRCARSSTRTFSSTRCTRSRRWSSATRAACGG